MYKLIPLQETQQLIIVDTDIKPVNGKYYDTFLKKIRDSGGAEYVESGITLQIVSESITNSVEKIYFMQQQKEIGDKIKEYGWSLDGTSEENDMERIANFFLTTYGFTRQNMDMAISFGFEKCKQYGDITKPEREEFYKQIIFLKIKEANVEIELADDNITTDVPVAISGGLRRQNDLGGIGIVRHYAKTPKLTDGKITIIKIL